MVKKPQRKGPWVHRFLVMVFATIFGVLLYLLLGYVVDDIDRWPGPEYSELLEQRLAPELLKEQKELNERIAATETELSDLRAEQQVLQQSISTYERTLNQLSELQKMRLEKDVPPSEKEQEELVKSSERFFAKQAEFEQLNDHLKQLIGRQRDLSTQKDVLELKLVEAGSGSRTQLSWEYITTYVIGG